MQLRSLKASSTTVSDDLEFEFSLLQSCVDETVANLPAEIAHLYEEAEAKQMAINECMAIVNRRDSAIQAFIKHNGSILINPKEEQYRKTIIENLDKAMALQDEKLALVTKAAAQFDRQVKRLDIKIRDLQADGTMPTDPQMPTLLRDSVGNLAPPASTSGTGTNTPLQPVSSNINGGHTNIANAAIARISSAIGAGRSSSVPMPMSMQEADRLTMFTNTNINLPAMQPHPMLNSSHLANAPSIAAMNINRGMREMSVSSDVKRRRITANLGSLPPQGSNLRQSSLGPGTPKPSTPGGSRAGSLGPRPMKKATTKRVPASQLARKKLTKGGLPKKLGRRITGLSRASPSTTGDESAISETSDDENTSNLGGDDMDMDDDTQEDNTPYCYCREKSHGSMIMCDNADCKIQWFHWTCVGINEDPTGDWFCKECSKLPPSKIRKAPQG